MESGLEHRTINRENPGSNPLAAISKLGQFHSLNVASLHCINEYPAIDSGGCVNE